MEVLPEYNSKIIQANIGGGHRYKVDGVNCTTCANCRKGKPCIGLPSVTSITGKYVEGDMYGAGYRAAMNTVFGSYTNSDKTDVESYNHDMGQGILQSFAEDIYQQFDVAMHHQKDIDTDGWAAIRRAVEAVETSSQKAMARGREVHLVLQEWLQAKLDGVEPFLDSHYIDQARQIVDWLDRHECEIVDVEVNVYHP